MPTERWPDNSSRNELRGMETSWARKWPVRRSQNVESALGEWPVVLGNLKPPPSLVNTGGTPTTQHVVTLVTVIYYRERTWNTVTKGERPVGYSMGTRLGL